MYAPPSAAHLAGLQLDWSAPLLCPTAILVPSSAAVGALPLAVAYAALCIRVENLISRGSWWPRAHRKPTVSFIIDEMGLGERGLSAPQIDNWFAALVYFVGVQDLESGFVCDLNGLSALEFPHHSQPTMKDW